jgi:hypothetical protein
MEDWACGLVGGEGGSARTKIDICALWIGGGGVVIKKKALLAVYVYPSPSPLHQHHSHIFSPHSPGTLFAPTPPALALPDTNHTLWRWHPREKRSRWGIWSTWAAPPAREKKSPPRTEHTLEPLPRLIFCSPKEETKERKRERERWRWCRCMKVQQMVYIAPHSEANK